MDKYYTYHLINGKKEVFYVGMCRAPKQRLNCHRHAMRYNPYSTYAPCISAKEIEMVIIGEHDTKEDASRHETKVIRKYRIDGIKLTNSNGSIKRNGQLRFFTDKRISFIRNLSVADSWLLTEEMKLSRNFYEKMIKVNVFDASYYNAIMEYFGWQLTKKESMLNKLSKYDYIKAKP